MPRPGSLHLSLPHAHAARGFSLFEMIFVIALLGLVSVSIMKIQPGIWKNQTVARDEYVGFELMQACAERLLTKRRREGFGSVTDALCANLGGQGGFAASPTVVLKNDVDATVTTCATTTCTATITISKTGSSTPALSALTVRLSAY